MSDKKCEMCRAVGHNTGSVLLIIIGFIWLLSAMRLISWDLISVLLAALLILVGVKKMAMYNYCKTECDCESGECEVKKH